MVAGGGAWTRDRPPLLPSKGVRQLERRAKYGEQHSPLLPIEGSVETLYCLTEARKMLDGPRVLFDRGEEDA